MYVDNFNENHNGYAKNSDISAINIIYQGREKSMKSVIIIEDDIDASNTLNDVCEIGNIRVLAKGYDGKEAIELFKQHKPDVVLLDIMMPQYNGFYAIEGIQKIKKDAKIVVVTASIDQETQDKLAKLNVPIIQKPYDINDIVNAVNTC